MRCQGAFSDVIPRWGIALYGKVPRSGLHKSRSSAAEILHGRATKEAVTVVIRTPTSKYRTTKTNNTAAKSLKYIEYLCPGPYFSEGFPPYKAAVTC
jgi:hypothetical protein